MDTSNKNARRQYNRRTDDERIAELEDRIKSLQAKSAIREKKTDPVIKEIPKVQRRLQKFAQLAMDHGRQDIANSITAFNSGLERILRSETEKAARESSI
jgi:molecular chaperone GrpE (heat shock protein)